MHVFQWGLPLTSPFGRFVGKMFQVARYRCMQIVRALVVTEDSPMVNTGGFGEWKTQAAAAARHSNTAYSFHTR